MRREVNYGSEVQGDCFDWQNCAKSKMSAQYFFAYSFCKNNGIIRKQKGVPLIFQDL